MSSFSMEFTGLEELIKTVEELGTEQDLEKANKKVLEKCGDLAYKVVQPLIHKSKDNSKSGPQHKGSPRLVPPGHAANNVPKPRIKKKNGRQYVIVGWEKGDNSEFFYMKMEEWGTSKRPPHHSFGKVNKILRKQYDNIAIKEYENLIKKLER